MKRLANYFKSIIMQRLAGWRIISNRLR